MFGSQDVSSFPELTPVILNAGDSDDCVALSEVASWNQTSDDWRFMLSLDHAVGFKHQNKLIATSLLVPYAPDTAWISMVLVHPDWRRKGLATALMRWCIDTCSNRNWTALLDATPDGKNVYENIGFASGPTITRFVRDSAPDSISALSSGQDLINPTAVLEAIVNIDEKHFGANRRPLFSYLLKISGVECRTAIDDGHLSGFIFLRPGRQRSHIGPLVSDNASVAISLLHEVVDVTDGSLAIDVPDIQSDMIAELKRIGFVEFRPFVRMQAGGYAGPGLENTFAIAGPEFG